MTEHTSGHAPYWRLFWAIPLPGELHEAIAAIQMELARKMPLDAVRWIPPVNVHLTLTFLGNWPQGSVPRLAASVEEATRKVRPFHLRLSNLGVFPHVRHPRVIWLGVEGELNTLRKLQEAVAQAMVQHGWQPDSRPYTPHLTIGRVRKGLSRTTLSEIGRIVERTKVASFGGHQVREIILFKSDLRPSGAVYTPVSRIKLTAG